MSDKILLKTILAFTLALVIVLGLLLSWIYFFEYIQPYLQWIDHNPTITGVTIIIIGAWGIICLNDKGNV